MKREKDTSPVRLQEREFGGVRVMLDEGDRDRPIDTRLYQDRVFPSAQSWVRQFLAGSLDSGDELEEIAVEIPVTPAMS